MIQLPRHRLFATADQGLFIFHRSFRFIKNETPYSGSDEG